MPISEKRQAPLVESLPRSSSQAFCYKGGAAQHTLSLLAFAFRVLRFAFYALPFVFSLPIPQPSRQLGLRSLIVEALSQIDVKEVNLLRAESP